MELINICSGSKKNSTLIYNNDTLILIDTGMGVRELTKVLKEMNKKIDDIDYIFITHEHTDHIKNIKYFNKDKIFSLKKVVDDLNESNYLELFKEYNFNSFIVTPLLLSHDSNNIMGLIIKDTKNNDVLGYITDTGFIPFITLKYLYNLNYYYFESNYDNMMLHESSRSDELKGRIAGIKGHLSNDMSSIYLDELIGKDTSKILLAHLSEECNDPEVALLTHKSRLSLNPNFKHIDIRCCKQREITKL